MSTLTRLFLNTSLVIMIEKLRVSLDQNGTCTALLTDLFKAFDCLPNDLLIPKLHANGCDLPPFKLLKCYLDHNVLSKHFV